jgi:predicted transposase YbfD/YdcC
MKPTKHIGRMKNTGAKVVVVFRTLPGESNSALVLPVSTLTDAYHDALMQMLESDQAQEAFEFGEMMFIRHFPDGRPMLQAMQVDGRLQKVATDNVIMTPTINAAVPLDQLNVLIAEQRNCTVDDLCTFVSGAKADAQSKAKKEEKAAATVVAQAQASTNEVLSDSDIAKSYRSQADAMYKEAARLRKEADALDPPKKKTTVKETESA